MDETQEQTVEEANPQVPQEPDNAVETPQVESEVSNESISDSEEKKTSEQVDQNVAAQEEVQEQADPSYNCQPCKGLGLIDENTRCPSCGGTGKV